MYRHHEDEIIVSNRATTMNSFVAPLIPIMAVVLIAFLIIGVALPVLPLHVHQDLGFGAFIVGLVTGSQFGASLLSRVSAGHYADRRGPKRAVVIGLMTAIVAGLLYFLSLYFAGVPRLSVTILLFGRALLGRAESFIITGAQLGTRSRWREECGAGHRLDRHGNVRGAGTRGAARDRALFCRRLRRCRDRNDANAVPTGPGRRSIVARLAAAWRPAVTQNGGRRGLAARFGCGTEQHRLRRDHRFQFAPLRATRMEPGLARVHFFRGFAGRSAFAARSRSGLAGRRQSGAGLHANRSGWSCADLVRARPCMGHSWSRARGLRLFTGLPRPWRRSRASRATAKPRPRHGRLHSLSRCGARLWQSDARPGRQPVWPRCGISRQRADRTRRLRDRAARALYGLFRKERAMPHVIVKLWPSKSEKQKAKLAEEITRAVMTVLNYGEESVSVAMEEVKPNAWMDKVYKPDITGKPEQIYKKPGYSSV